MWLENWSSRLYCFFRKLRDVSILWFHISDTINEKKTWSLFDSLKLSMVLKQLATSQTWWLVKTYKKKCCPYYKAHKADAGGSIWKLEMISMWATPPLSKTWSSRFLGSHWALFLSYPNLTDSLFPRSHLSRNVLSHTPTPKIVHFPDSSMYF